MFIIKPVISTCFGHHYGLIINIRLVAFCWFLSLHPTFMMHGHENLKFDSWKFTIKGSHSGVLYIWLLGFWTS